MGSTKMGDGTLLFAGEAGAYNGPWANPDDMRKINSLMRYTQGTAQDGFSITGMAYSNKWNSTDQVPQRAITSGQIGLFGEEDPTDGGNTSRFALSARMAGTDDAGSWKANAYAVKSGLELFNKFTFFLTNPTAGRSVSSARRPRDDRRECIENPRWLVRRPTDGNHLRRPDQVRRHQSCASRIPIQRSFLSNVRSDRVTEASVGIYAQNTIHWTDWFRTTIGLAR